VGSTVASLAQLGSGPAVIGQSFSPGQWIDQLVDLIVEWLSGQVSQTFLQDAATLLLVGGLTMLVLVVFLVVLGSALSKQQDPADYATSTSEAYQLRPTPHPGLTPEVLRSIPVGTGTVKAREKRELIRLPVDVLVEQMIRAGAGEPRILEHTRRRTTLRLYGCPDCRGQHYARRPPSAPPTVQGCDREAQRIERLFRRRFGGDVRVHEITCRRGGVEHCEFEVRK
jgi:hypothetical protein